MENNVQRDIAKEVKLADLFRARKEARNHRYARAGQRRGRDVGDAARHRVRLLQDQMAAHYARVAARIGEDLNPYIQALHDDEAEGDLASVSSEGTVDNAPEESDVLIITGTNNRFVIDGVMYMQLDGGLVPYCKDTRTWGGEVFPYPYRIVKAGTVLTGVKTVEIGVYTMGGDKVAVTHSPFQVVRNFVISAKQMRWFKTLRNFLADAGSNIMNVATIGYADFWPEHPFRYLTKIKKDIQVYSPLYSWLLENKVASGVSADNVLLLSRIVFRDWASISVEILIETMLFFTFQKSAIYSEALATTVPLSEFLTAGKRFKALREPEFNNYTAGMLIAGLGDITHEGWYKINSEEEVKLWDAKGQTCITRLPYVQSSDAHGYGRERVKQPGHKFEVIDNATVGAEWLDPYILFDTDVDNRCVSKGYQSVGSCFATMMQVIDGKLTREVERCFLRLSLLRDDEFDLRAAQIKAVGPALKAGRRLTQGLDERITRAILTRDKDYEPDEPIDQEDDAIISPLQKIIRDVHSQYQRLQMPPALLAEIINAPLEAIRKYILYVGGPKMNKRLSDLEKHKRDIGKAPKKYNPALFKADEAQKYKIGKDGNPVLKFGRLTISITGNDWILANPSMMYAMKNIIEKELTVTRVAAPINDPALNPLVGGVAAVEHSLIEIDGQVLRSEVLLDYNLWYRAVLTDTSNEDLKVIDAKMVAWCSEGPNRMAAISHGDDIDVITSDRRGRLSALEVDISDNDGSYTDSLLRLEAQEVGVNCDPVEAYAQLANPIIVTNPQNENEKIVMRSKLGMIRCSGGIGTTYGNSKGSFLVILSHALSGLTQDIKKSAADVGFNVTYNAEEWSLEQSCFLSRFRYEDIVNGVAQWNRMTCLASIARNFGRATGDLPGSSKKRVDQRWMEYIQGVVAGYVNEPDSLFMRSLRVKYGRTSIRGFYDMCRSNTLSHIDHGIIRHYYNPDEYDSGIQEYLATINLIQTSPAFGTVIASAFIDRIMAKRYGMASVCK
jgi:hypothetical protein